MAESPSGVIWNWRARSAAGAPMRSARRLRRQGLIQGAVLVAVALLLKFVLHRSLPGDVLVVLAAVVLLMAVWRPAWLAPWLRLGRRIGSAVGTGLAWLLLTPFFALFMVPGALLLRLRGRDPLARRPLDPGLTGWIPRGADPSPESMARQYLVEDRAARALRRPLVDSSRADHEKSADS